MSFRMFSAASITARWRVKSGPTLKKGSRITIRLFLPDEPTTPIELKAEVLGPFGEHGGVRMKFINPPVEAVRRIHRLLT